MNNADLIARLPSLERVHETLRTTDPGEVLATAMAGTGAAGPKSQAGLESVAESAGTVPGADRLPQNERVEGALQSQREATVAAGQRAVQKILQGGPETPLASPYDATVRAVHVAEGDRVAGGALLVELDD